MKKTKEGELVRGIDGHRWVSNLELMGPDRHRHGISANYMEVVF